MPTWGEKRSSSFVSSLAFVTQTLIYISLDKKVPKIWLHFIDDTRSAGKLLTFRTTDHAKKKTILSNPATTAECAFDQPKIIKASKKAIFTTCLTHPHYKKLEMTYLTKTELNKLKIFNRDQILQYHVHEQNC